MHHGKTFHTHKIMQMIFSLHDMCNEAAMQKLHPRTKEINVFKPSPCKCITSKALKSAMLFRLLLKKN